MTESEWLDFIARGDPTRVTVGRLSDDLARFLGCYTNQVQLRHDYALKCSLKHGLRPDHFTLLPLIIDLGVALHDSRAPRHLTLMFSENAVFGSSFELAIKATSFGHELHVCSFHKTTVSEYNRLLRKHEIVRQAKD